MKAAVFILAFLGTAFAAPSLKALGIVDGWEVPPHSIPYQVYIVGHGNQAAWFCSGSLISPQFVLTAAHCLTGAERVTVYLGVHNLHAFEPGHLAIGARNIIIHEHYNQQFFDNDIALIHLDGEVAPSLTIQYAKLPIHNSPPHDLVGNVGRVSGWGLTHGQDTQRSSVLRATEDIIVPNNVCWNAYHNVNDQELCFGGEHTNKPCRGDSGGPLVIGEVQEGIFSYGNFECLPQWPSVFERVRAHMNWIQTHTGLH